MEVYLERHSCPVSVSIYGVTYQVVDLPWRYTWEDVCTWCNQRFGKSTGVAGRWLSPGDPTLESNDYYTRHPRGFFFKNETDLLVFTLKWL